MKGCLKQPLTFQTEWLYERYTARLHWSIYLHIKRRENPWSHYSLESLLQDTSDATLKLCRNVHETFFSGFGLFYIPYTIMQHLHSACLLSWIMCCFPSHRWQFPLAAISAYTVDLAPIPGNYEKCAWYS